MHSTPQRIDAMNDNDTQKIYLRVADVEQAIPMSVHLNTDEEEIIRKAVDMVNDIWTYYLNRHETTSTKACLAMAAVAIAQIYLKTDGCREDILSRLDDLSDEMEKFFETPENL